MQGLGIGTLVSISNLCEYHDMYYISHNISMYNKKTMYLWISIFWQF